MKEQELDRKSCTYTLANALQIPCTGFGTWQIPEGDIAIQSVSTAIDAGYRHIDTAAAYENENSVGVGIAKSGVKRSNLFVTSKVWNTERGYAKTLAAYEKTISDLKLDYLDLYLIHWPAGSSQYENWDLINLDTWSAMTDLYKAKKVKAIGVCNFLPHHLASLIKTEIKPMVNQIEFHPGQMQKETLDYCNSNDILVEAWGSLGMGKMLNNETLAEIAAKYQKSVAQLCIRWCLQNGVLPLTKSITASRIRENLEVFDFEISNEDMIAINEMPYFGGSGLHPDEVDF